MKKFTLFMLVTLMSVTAFAQKEFRMAPVAKMRQTLTIQGLQRQAQPVFSKTQPAAPEAIVLPEGVEAAPYVMTFIDYYQNTSTAPVNVAVDGTDVYFQGLSEYFPEAWVKGTLADGIVTFPASQYVGTTEDLDSYFFYEGPAAFTYDAQANTYTAEGTIYGVLGNEYYDGVYTDPVLSGVVEKAVMPANPAITALENSDYGYRVSFNVPLIDVEGNNLLASKLSYELFVEEGGEVSPLTFTPATHSKLTEDMTVIPYGFTEGYDFYSSQIYLNDLYSADWSKIGIKSIYTGGDQTNETEIQWFNLDATAGSVWVAAEQGYANGDEVTDVTFAEGVTGTFAKADGSNAPKYYDAGTAVRMYAGNTLTVNATNPIAKIEFLFDTNEGKKIPAFDVNAGTVAISEEGTTGAWTGEATEIVFTVPNVSGQQARIQQVQVFFKGKETVTLPEGVVAETYYFKAIDTYSEQESSRDVQVAFNGENEVYFQGLSEFVPEAWVKGTLADGKVTIPETYLGVYESMFGDYELNFAGAEFTYDADKNMFTAESYQTTTDDGYPLDEYADITITKVVEMAATPATPSLAFAQSMFDESVYNGLTLNIPLEDINGNPMVSSKLSYVILYEKDNVVSTLEFTTALYEKITENMTEIPYNYDDDWDISNSYIYLNQDEDELKSWSKVGVQSIYRGGGEENKSEIGWFDMSAYWSGINNIKADLNDGKAVIYNMAGQRLQHAQKGLNIINGKKVVMK